MTKVGEQELKETIKKSEFNGMIGTIVSTATVLFAIFFGGLKIVDVITTRVTTDVVVRMNKDISDLKKEQSVTDDIQDSKMSNHDIRLDRLENSKQPLSNIKSN